LIIETSGADDQVVKILCPLTIKESNLDRGLGILEEAVRKICASKRKIPEVTDIFEYKRKAS
jgi:diaminobutyrate-2-oxoglutarate transaminase